MNGRILLRIGVVTAVSVCFFFVVVQPYRQNTVQKSVTAETGRAFGRATPALRTQIARGNLAELQRWGGSLLPSTEYHVLLAANLRLLGRRSEAISEYERAIAIEQRPEIYIYLAETELQEGRVEKAITHFAAAARFARKYLERVPPDLVEPVRRQL